MNCPSCGHENPAGSNFCLECGAAFTVRCANCDAEFPASAKFCNRCGRPSGETQPAPTERDPRAYTPKHLADKILTSRSALEGERKQVTVLFADVKGSVGLSGAVDPEEWHRIMERFVLLLAEGVHRFEGKVNQFTGDGIMALFGAPIAHEDHAQRACYAALRLRDEAREFADELRRTKGLSFSVRIGLNSGEVVVGKIGDDLRMDYTAHGQVVGLASRVEELAEPGRAYLTDQTARLVEGFFQLRDLGEFDLKGVAESLRIYELEGTTALRTRLDVSRARGFSRFVGRVDEMATLELALHRAQEGNGQVVGVVGEAGVGKSRLCSEFVDRCRATQIRVLEAHCPAHGKTVPLLPILELLRNSFGITAQDTDEAAREKIAGRLVRLDRALDDVLPLVFDFLGVPDADQPAPQMDAEARQRQLHTFVRNFYVRARSGREPTVFLFDDTQWIDQGSDAYLAELVEATSGTKTLLLANFRPEYRAEWMGRSDYQQLPLSPLDPEAIDELLHELLGSDLTLAGLHDLVRERTGGNPFFIEEVVQSLVESESLSGTRGTYRLVTPVDELAIPATVQAVLAARIDRLPEREKQVLQTAAVAAVVDKRFSESLLGRVAGLPEPDLAAALSRLHADEFLVEEALYPELEYGFKHPLTQAVAYDTQLSDRRAEIHAALARGLEEIHAEKLDEHAALLAHHWEEAGEALPAARWHRCAALWAGTNDVLDSIRHWRRGRELAGSLEESKEASRLGLEACRGILNAGWRLGDTEELAAVFEEGRVLAERLGDLRTLAILWNLYGNVKGLSGDLRGGYDRVCEAARIAARSQDEGVTWALQVDRITNLGWFGRWEEALREFDALGPDPEDRELGRDVLDLHVDSARLFARVWLLAEAGHLAEARRCAERAIALGEGDGEPETVLLATIHLVSQALHSGDSRSLLEPTARMVGLADEAGSNFARVSARAWLGAVLAACEEGAAAIEALEEALTIIRETGAGGWFRSFALAHMAQACLASQDPIRARETAEEAVSEARRIGALGQELCASVAKVRILLALGEDDDEIDATLSRASELIAETGGRSYEPQVRELRARLAQTRGDATAASGELREAHRLYTEMGATGHAERVARELAQLGGT